MRGASYEDEHFAKVSRDAERPRIAIRVPTLWGCSRSAASVRNLTPEPSFTLWARWAKVSLLRPIRRSVLPNRCSSRWWGGCQQKTSTSRSFPTLVQLDAAVKTSKLSDRSLDPRTGATDPELPLAETTRASAMQLERAIDQARWAAANCHLLALRGLTRVQTLRRLSRHSNHRQIPTHVGRRMSLPGIDSSLLLSREVLDLELDSAAVDGLDRAAHRIDFLNDLPRRVLHQVVH